MKKIIVITIREVEEDNGHMSVSFNHSGTNEDGSAFVVTYDKVASMLSRVNMSVLGQSFMQEAIKKAQESANADRALLQAATDSLNKATEVMIKALGNKAKKVKK